MYMNQLSQHFTYIYICTCIVKENYRVHTICTWAKVWSPPRNHGSMLLGDKFIGTYISSQIQKLKYSNNY